MRNAASERETIRKLQKARVKLEPETSEPQVQEVMDEDEQMRCLGGPLLSLFFGSKT
jgi:hypothetical protein